MVYRREKNMLKVVFNWKDFKNDVIADGQCRRAGRHPDV